MVWYLCFALSCCCVLVTSLLLLPVILSSLCPLFLLSASLHIYFLFSAFSYDIRTYEQLHPIVVMSPDPPSAAVWTSIGYFKDVYYIKVMVLTAREVLLFLLMCWWHSCSSVQIVWVVIIKLLSLFVFVLFLSQIFSFVLLSLLLFLLSV